ncbi:MAG: hypothetical protein WD135_03185, partial [Ferruginibacter sp.]
MFAIFFVIIFIIHVWLNINTKFNNTYFFNTIQRLSINFITFYMHRADGSGRMMRGLCNPGLKSVV